jgi:uncharacterized protein (TIGR03086 family)
MTTTPDPRPHYSAALTWVTALMDGVDTTRLDDPTPCTGFDVRALLGHLVSTVDRARVIGEGVEPFSSVPPVTTGVADGGWAEAYRAAAEAMWKTWTDDGLLDRTVTAPWGTAPGRAVVWGYLNETLVHGWDLAVATGQDPEADPVLAEAVLQVARTVIPAEVRGGEVPFAAVARSRPDAGPTERLANWSGHARP